MGGPIQSDRWNHQGTHANPTTGRSTSSQDTGQGHATEGNFGSDTASIATGTHATEGDFGSGQASVATSSLLERG